MPPKTPRCTLRTRRLAVLAFAALSLLAAPLPTAAAQEPAPAPSEPRELWRQFPLDEGRGNGEARPRGSQREERGPRGIAPPATAPSDRSAPADAGRSNPTMQLSAAELAVVYVLALVLLLTPVLLLAIGARSYAASGRIGLHVGGVRRRLRRPFQLGAARRADRIAGEQVAIAARPTAPGLRTHAAANAVVVHTSNGSLAAGEPQRIEAQPEVHSASPGNPVDDEREILKAKLARSATPAGAERADEVETLKAKRVGNASAPAEDTSLNEVLKTKLVEGGALAKTLPRGADDVAVLKAKSDRCDQAGDERAAVSKGPDTRDASVGARAVGDHDLSPRRNGWQSR